MKVETFEVEDVTDAAGRLDEQATAEYLEMIAKLELDGQQAILRVDPETDTKTVIPYRQLSKADAAAVAALCPHIESLAKYRGDMIPLRVLQVIGHCKEAALFDEIEVLSTGAADLPDPILVGIVGRRYDGTRYVLARWGDELFPWPELAERAYKALVARWTSEQAEHLDKCKAFHVESQARSQLRGEYVNTPW